MSKFKHILFPAREKGWELWRLAKNGNNLVESFAIDDEIDLPRSTKVAFSSHDVASWPVILPKNDKQVQRQMAQLNLEQHGIIKADSAIWDIFSASGEDNLYAGAVLSRNSLSHHKSHTELTFDVTARLYQVGPGDRVLCKREHGKWISIFYKSSIPFYWEPIDSLDSLPSQLKVLSLEFAQQKIPFAPEKFIIEATDTELSVDGSHLPRLEEVCGIHVDYVQAVDFRDNTKYSLDLAPSSVNLERKSRKGRRNILFLILLVLIVYGVVAFFFYEQYKRKNSEINTLQDKVTLLSPGWRENQQDITKLNELDDVMTNHWPLALLERVHSSLPETLEIRFESVEINSGSIVIKGVAPLNITLINDLSLALKNDEYFKDYRWTMPTQEKNQKTQQWEFTMVATKLSLAE